MFRSRMMYFVCLCFIGTAILIISGGLIHSSTSFKKADFDNRINLLKKPTCQEKVNIPKYYDFKSEPYCRLTKHDPWDPEVIKHVNLKYIETYPCLKGEKFTRLVNHTLYTTSRDHKCRGRCITRETDLTNTEGPWSNLPASFICEFIEAECTLLTGTKVVYNALHTQIEAKKEELPNAENANKPSVFIILIDSMSWSQAHRTIPKTMHFLENSMEAVSFPFVNKVGMNSKPNGFALWFGKLMEGVDRSAFGLPSMPSEISLEEACDRYLDNETSIFDAFKRSGYKTFLAEDWARGMISWPACAGFEKQPVDHTMQPFMVAVDKSPLVKESYSVKYCITLVDELFSYLQQFINAYKGDPKFAFLWSSVLSHDYYEQSMRVDTKLLDFLVKNRKLFDDSYVILMGDHGFRFGEITNTKLGAIDINNPMLTISVPKHLRESEITEIMRRNSESLQTHFDTRATLLDILDSNVSNLDSRNNASSRELGQSLLRKQYGERSCTLPIPFEYCICDFEQTEMDTLSRKSIAAGKAVISSVNDLLTKEKVVFKCPLWRFSKVLSISAFSPSDESIAYNIVVGVSEPYDKALFRATVIEASNGSLSVGTIDRQDEYGYRGNCLHPDLWRFCDCKKGTKF